MKDFHIREGDSIMTVEIRELPKYEIAYIRRVGSYFEPQDHWGKLLDWAIRNGLVPPNQHFIGISLDDPNIVEGHQCRHDACVTVPKGFAKESHKEVEFRQLDGGLYVMYPFYDQVEKLVFAYQYVFEVWLPTTSEYEVDYSRNNLEFNQNNPADDPEGKGKVDLFIPIKEVV